MKAIFLSGFFIGIIALLCLIYFVPIDFLRSDFYSRGYTHYTNSSISVYFSPENNLEKIWIDTINRSTNYIYVSCFGISNDKISECLVKNKKNGRKIIVCVDNLQSRGNGSDIELLKKYEIEVVVKKTKTLEHNKFLVVDGRDAIIGSYNLSESSQKQDSIMTNQKNNNTLN